MENQAGQQGTRARADLLTAVVLVILGLAIFYYAYTMPRLEARRIHPATIPGLVPMALSAILVLLGGLLGVKAWKGQGDGSWADFFAVFRTLEAARAVAALAMVLIFALGLVGWLPFWAASMLFLFAFIVTMEAVLTSEQVNLPKTLIWASVTAIVAGAGIYYLFAELFLVRLP